MDRGLLRAGDPRDAALQFTALLRGELFFHCLFDPSFAPSKVAKARQIAEAVDCFAAKYGAANVLKQRATTTKRPTHDGNKKRKTTLLVQTLGKEINS